MDALRRVWDFLVELNLLAAFDLHRLNEESTEPSQARWCVRRVLLGDDTEVVAEIYDTTMPGKDDKRSQERQAFLAELFAASPSLLFALLHILTDEAKGESTNAAKADALRIVQSLFNNTQVNFEQIPKGVASPRSDENDRADGQ